MNPRTLLALLASLCFWGSVCVAQDGAQPLTWDVLVQQRTDSFTRLREIVAAIRQVPPEQRETLAQEYMALTKSLRETILPGLEQQVPQRLQQQPDDPQTREIASEVMQHCLNTNRYEQAKQFSELILEVDGTNPLAANVGGVSRFALHEFEDAARQLKSLQDEGKLISELGGRYLDSANNYIEYWKTEQQIRSGESALPGNQQLPRVLLTTSRGKILVELFENEAPNTVANFVHLVEKEFYDGLKFHRVIPSFMIQGGSPLSRDGDPNDPRVGSGGPGYRIPCECYQPNARRHFAGSLSMAHAGRDTGGSQFFITHLPTPHLDQEVAPQSVHTVFGRVVEGMDVVAAIQPGDEIVSAEVTRKRDHEYLPQTRPGN